MGFRKGVENCEAMGIPLLGKEGWPRLSSEASRRFIDGASTLLFQEGNTQVRY